MSQQKVINLLEKLEKPITSKDISKKLNLSIGSIRNNIHKLIKHQEIKSVIIPLKFEYVLSLFGKPIIHNRLVTHYFL